MATDTAVPAQRIVIDDPWSPLDRRSDALRAEDRRPLDGRRLAALFVDGLVLAPVSLVLLVLVDSPYRGVLAFATMLSYFFLCEALTGQTIGKRVFGLRVVRLDGRPLTVASASARNVLLLIDALPGLYLVGFASMILSRRRQRIGDLAAGTVVTWAADHPHIAASEHRRTAMLVAYPAAWIAVVLVAVTLAGHRDAQVHYVAEANGLCATTRASLAALDGSASSVRAAGESFASLRAALASMSPPGGLRGAHAKLLADEQRTSEHLLGLAAYLHAPHHTLRGTRLRLERLDAERRADARALHGTGLAGCV